MSRTVLRTHKSYSCMALSMSEMLVQNEVSMPKPARTLGISGQQVETAQHEVQENLCSHLNYVVFCEPTESFTLFTKLYTNMRAVSHQVQWVKFDIIVELPSSCHTFGHFAMVSNLKFWFTINSFLTPRIADITILYSCKVLRRL